MNLISILRSVLSTGRPFTGGTQLPNRASDNGAETHHVDESEYLALSEASFCLAVLVLTMAVFTAAVPPAKSDMRSSLEIKTAAKLPTPEPSATDGASNQTQPTHRWSGSLEATGTTSAEGAVIIEVSAGVFATLQHASSIKLITEKL